MYKSIIMTLFIWLVLRKKYSVCFVLRVDLSIFRAEPG
jgi:hypothetical protein